MASETLSTAAALQCPHGGTVKIAASNTKVTLGGSPVATVSDTFTVSGCSFQIPATPPIPSPCMQVQWTVSDVQAKVGGVATLSKASTGICLAASGAPQGPVSTKSTQTKVKTT